MKTLEKIIAGVLLVGTLGATSLGCQNTNKSPRETESMESRIVPGAIKIDTTSFDGKIMATFMGETYNIDPFMLGNVYKSTINRGNDVTVWVDEIHYFDSKYRSVQSGDSDVKWLVLSKYPEVGIDIVKNNSHLTYTGWLNNDRNENIIRICTEEELHCLFLYDEVKNLTVDSVFYDTKQNDAYFDRTQDNKKIIDDAQKLFDKYHKLMKQELRAFEKMNYRAKQRKDVQQYIENLNK